MAFPPTANIPLFNGASRVMLIAAHPDDETLPCAVILQKAVRAGAALRVIYITDGEDNPWPQRWLEWKWQLGATDRQRWGRLRRTEALSALSVLGVNVDQVRFLGLPDQGLSELLLHKCDYVLTRLADIIDGWCPTHIFSPSNFDTHPDHNALAVMLRLVMAEFFPNRPDISHWNYRVHGQSSGFFTRATELPQSKAEIHNKRQAIFCHRTQLQLSKRRFLRYAARPEAILRVESDSVACCEGSIGSVSRSAEMLEVDLRLGALRARLQEHTLLVLGRSSDRKHYSLRIRFPVRSGPVEIISHGCDCVAEAASYRANAFAAKLTVPVKIFSPEDDLFIKFVRPSWFFDEAGWIQIPALIRRKGLEPIAGFEKPLLATG
jgi:LmbE family N-acetylglucosaminyl deacetylase